MNEPKPILLVEDEEHDVLFMRIALQRADVTNPLVVVRDGREAIAYLAYIVKRSDLGGLVEIVRRIKKYWLDADQPPPDCRDWLSLTQRRPGSGAWSILSSSRSTPV